MQQGNFTSINWGSSNFFNGYVQDNNIYTMTNDLIGVNLAKYQEVEQALIKCKDRLIELGEIKMPKTQEEIIQEQSDMLEKQSNILNDMMNKFNELQQQMGDIKNEHTTNKKLSELSTTEYEEQGITSDNQSSGDGRPDTNTNKRGCNKSVAKSKK